MQVAKVTGTAVATIKDARLTGVKLLVVQFLNKYLEPIGSQKVVADASLKAGLGDLVILVRSKDASLALDVPGAPVDLSVVGIIDTVNVTENALSYTLQSG